LSNEKLLKELRERTVQQFLDIVILEALNDFSNPRSGPDIVNYIHKNFGVLIDLGLVYSYLSAMERKGLIHGFSKEIFEKRTRRFYKLTNNGENLVETLTRNQEDIVNFVKLMFKSKSKMISQ
jgi:DNA-binding PadR family transcriptional regulator